MTVVYLLRHGAIEWPQPDCFIGQTDAPLNDEGRRQIDRWRRHLGKGWFSSVWSSDLLRAKQTAEMLVPEEVIQTCPELREINLGDWEGKPQSRIQAEHPELWNARGQNFAEFRPPGGESFSDLLNRAKPCVERICAALSGPALVVTHAGVIRVLICDVLGIPISNLFRIHLDYGGLTIINYRESAGTLVSLNLFRDAPWPIHLRANSHRRSNGHVES